MHRIDGPGATAENQFTEGNPGTGTPATVVTDDWLTAVQEEIAGVVEASGAALAKGDKAAAAVAVAEAAAAETAEVAAWEHRRSRSRIRARGRWRTKPLHLRR